MSALLLESKRRLRREMARRRREVSPAVAARAAAAAAQSLIATEPARRARRIALYAALPGELPTRPLFDAVVKGYGSALLPRAVEPMGLEFSPVLRWGIALFNITIGPEDTYRETRPSFWRCSTGDHP